VFACGLGGCWTPPRRARAGWGVRVRPATRDVDTGFTTALRSTARAPSGVPVMPPITAPPSPALARIRTWLARALVAAALAVPLGVVTPLAAATPDPAPDPAPHVGPDPAVADNAAAPARRPEVEAKGTPARAQPAPAQQQSPVRQPPVSSWTPPATASAARSGTADRARASRARRSAKAKAKQERRAPTVVAVQLPAMPSGPLPVRAPPAGSSGGDGAASALVLAGLALLLLVGASASFLYATAFGSDDPSRIRPT
jgi:hypothetical protein